MHRALLVLLLPSVALADRLTMKRLDGTNLHIAGNRGAIHWSEDTTVVLDLAADHKLAAAVSGTRGESNLYTSYSTDDVTTWATTWTGTWARQGDALVLDLALASERCARVKTSSDAAPVTLACRVPAKHKRVACTSAQVELADHTHADAWTCAGDDLGESPGWLLGKAGCLASLGGHMGRFSVQPCTP